MFLIGVELGRVRYVFGASRHLGSFTSRFICNTSSPLGASHSGEFMRTTLSLRVRQSPKYTDSNRLCFASGGMDLRRHVSIPGVARSHFVTCDEMTPSYGPLRRPKSAERSRIAIVIAQRSDHPPQDLSSSRVYGPRSNVDLRRPRRLLGHPPRPRLTIYECLSQSRRQQPPHIRTIIPKLDGADRSHCSMVVTGTK